jgi:hypothetical protein
MGSEVGRAHHGHGEPPILREDLDGAILGIGDIDPVSRNDDVDGPF